MTLAMDVADRFADSFPDYIDPFEPIMTGVTSIPVNKAVAGVQAFAESRHPSPQPSHLCVPHQAARRTTMGYVAPTFLEKPIQIKEGKDAPPPPFSRHPLEEPRI